MIAMYNPENDGSICVEAVGEQRAEFLQYIALLATTPMVVKELHGQVTELTLERIADLWGDTGPEPIVIEEMDVLFRHNNEHSVLLGLTKSMKEHSMSIATGIQEMSLLRKMTESLVFVDNRGLLVSRNKSKNGHNLGVDTEFLNDYIDTHGKIHLSPEHESLMRKHGLNAMAYQTEYTAENPEGVHVHHRSFGKKNGDGFYEPHFFVVGDIGGAES